MRDVFVGSLLAKWLNACGFSPSFSHGLRCVEGLVSVCFSQATAAPQQGSCCAWRERGEAKLGGPGRIGQEAWVALSPGLGWYLLLGSTARPKSMIGTLSYTFFPYTLSLMIIGMLCTP